MTDPTNYQAPLSSAPSFAEQESLLQSRGFSQARDQEKPPLPGQYTVKEVTTHDENGIPHILFTFLVNSGHCIKEFAGFRKP